MENFSFEKLLCEESSSEVSDLEGDDPPNSLKNKKKLFQLEPERERGSFFISQKYFENTLSPSLRKLYSKNGLSLPFKTLQVEIISGIPRCLELWREFSPQKTIFDSWEFRFAFYKSYQFKPYFILLKTQVENLALLPLWHDTERKKYFWFGSNWQEEVSLFSKDANYLPLLLSLAPCPCSLNAISKDAIGPLKDKIKFNRDQSKYILNLTNFKNHEDYLMTLKKNTRRNLRKDRNKITRLNPQLIFNNFSDFDTLVGLSKKRFEEKGQHTDWEDPRRIETFRQVIKLAGKSYVVRMLSVKIGKKTAGVDLIAIFNDTYYALKCGYNVREFPGIGNFINLLEIDDAIRLGLNKIDFLQNNYKWKSKYFEAIPLFKYEKKLS